MDLRKLWSGSCRNIAVSGLVSGCIGSGRIDRLFSGLLSVERNK